MRLRGVPRASPHELDLRTMRERSCFGNSRVGARHCTRCRFVSPSQVRSSHKRRAPNFPPIRGTRLRRIRPKPRGSCTSTAIITIAFQSPSQFFTPEHHSLRPQHTSHLPSPVRISGHGQAVSWPAAICATNTLSCRHARSLYTTPEL